MGERAVRPKAVLLAIMPDTDLLDWTRSNRYVRDLACSERELYRAVLTSWEDVEPKSRC